MTTIPPTAAPTIPAAAVAASGPVVVVQQPPPQILQLPPGSTLETVVVAAQQQPAQQQTAQPQRQTVDAETLEQPEARQQTITLRTSSGDVTVRTPVPLEDGAKVALEILRNAPNQVTARIVTIDGQPAQQALTQTAREAAAQAAPAPLPEKLLPLPNPTQAIPLQPGQAWTPQGPMPLTTLNPLSAFVLTAPITPAVQAAVQTPLQQTITQVFQPGADLGIRVVSLQAVAPPAITGAMTGTVPGAIPNLSAPITPQVATAQANTIAIPAQTATTQTTTPQTTITPTPGGVAAAQTPQTTTPAPSPNATAPQAAQTISPNVKSAAPSLVPVPLQATESQGLKLPNTQGPTSPTPAPPKTVEGTPIIVRMGGQVTSTTPGGAVIVQTPGGEIQLNVRANVPVGSTITFEVITTSPPRPDATGGIVLSAPTPAPAGLPLSTPAMGWGSVSEALQLLQRTDPQAAAQLANAIPDGGPRTALATMAFVQAMRSGDSKQWPGDTALRGLERAGPRGAQLAQQISGEVREMAARTADTGTEWRTLPMPWNSNGQIDRIALILRREGDSDEDADKKKGGKGKGTRFLVNLDLSRLGELQLDGMFHKSTRALDMMIRTKDPLPEDMRRDLMGLFATSNTAMGLVGGLSFQVVKRFPDPTATGPMADRGGLWA